MIWIYFLLAMHVGALAIWVVLPGVQAYLCRHGWARHAFTWYVDYHNVRAVLMCHWCGLVKEEWL